MEKLQTHIILEILGRPAENVQEALKGLLQRLGSEPGVKIIEETRHQPIPVKDTKNLFTAFAEITLELDSLSNYFGILFAYMPANIELVFPEKVVLKNDELNVLGNRLIQRLHDYDAIAKRMIVERDMAVGKLQELAPHIFQKQNQAQPTKSIKEKSRKKSKKKK